MSRFYDALSEAGGFRPDATPEEPNRVPGINGIPVTTRASIDPIACNLSAPVAVLDDDTSRISSEREPSESVGIPEVGSIRIPLTNALKHKALIGNAVDPSVVEHYRRLRTKIIQLHTTQPFRSLLVTSPSPEEGKTVTVLNLALSFAMLPSFKVLVVDGDLRRASLGNWLEVSERPGFSNLIEGTAEWADVVVKSDSMPISIIGSGTSKIPAAELLQSSQLKSQIQKMTEQFSLVLVDSPPVNLITDAQLLAASCDAVLIVTRAFVSTRMALEQAIQDLQPYRIIGTVLNGGTRSRLDHRYQGYY
jgi:capsular exopolysaccharide synthesis family protein